MASKIPIIFRGDDTDFNDDSRLSVSIDTDLPLEAFKVEIIFQGLRKICQGEPYGRPIHFSYSARQTASFKLGVYKMQIRLRDAKNRVRTLKPKLCIVTAKASEAEAWRESIAEAEQSVSVLNEYDIFDCGVTVIDLKERLAYLWQKLGGSVDDLKIENMMDVKNYMRLLWKKYGGTVTHEEEINNPN